MKQDLRHGGVETSNQIKEVHLLAITKLLLEPNSFTSVCATESGSRVPVVTCKPSF